MFKLAQGKEMNADLLAEFISKHNGEITTNLQKLWNAYKTDYDIFHMKNKESYKPDNRIAVNYAKYITDTFNGFFIGVPIKVTSEDEKVDKYLNLLDAYNDQDDNNAELSKICSIFGFGYEMYYVDEDGNIGITYVSPMDGFMVYDDSILERPRYFVYYYKDADGVLQGSVSDKQKVMYFNQKSGIRFTEEKIHGFDDVPATEYRENEERQGIFQPVMSMINAYNKAISEKANDVDYFADAYLKILGYKLENGDLMHIRDNRIINFEGEMDTNLIVDFLQKPDGDTTQENLLNRLERLIFQISMVANISDEEFGAASGISLKYKLLAMSNLALNKQRKFTSGMNRRYKVIFSNPVSGMDPESWVDIKYKFTQNFPANLLEESQIAGALSGITSKETQLTVLSVVDDVKKEMDKIKEDQDEEGYKTDFPTERVVDNVLEE